MSSDGVEWVTQLNKAEMAAPSRSKIANGNLYANAQWDVIGFVRIPLGKMLALQHDSRVRSRNALRSPSPASGNTRQCVHWQLECDGQSQDLGRLSAHGNNGDEQQ
jgi:hypothetical protein